MYKHINSWMVVFVFVLDDDDDNDDDDDDDVKYILYKK